MRNILVVDGRYACAADALTSSGPATWGDSGTFVPVAGSAVGGVKRRMTVVETTHRDVRGSSGAG